MAEMKSWVLRVCQVGILVLISVAARGQTLQQALDATNLTWTTSGSGWFGETTTTHDGVSAAASTSLSGTATATLQTTVTGPGTLTFWIYTPSSSGEVSFLIGSVTQAVYSINSSDSYSSWLPQTVYIGRHPLSNGYTLYPGHPPPPLIWIKSVGRLAQRRPQSRSSRFLINRRRWRQCDLLCRRRRDAAFELSMATQWHKCFSDHEFLFHDFQWTGFLIHDHQCAGGQFRQLQRDHHQQCGHQLQFQRVA